MRLYTAGEGYTYVAENGHGCRPVYVHRLVAFAHGLLDGLDDPREVHHLDGNVWLNAPENLVAVDPLEHSGHHLHDVPLETA